MSSLVIICLTPPPPMSSHVIIQILTPPCHQLSSFVIKSNWQTPPLFWDIDHKKTVFHQNVFFCESLDYYLKKSLSTLITSKEVSYQDVFFCTTVMIKCLGALNTRKRFPTSMFFCACLGYHQQKSLGTVITRKRFFTIMCIFRLQYRENILEHWSQEKFHTSMCFCALLNYYLEKSPVTLITSKRFLTRMCLFVHLQTTIMRKCLGTLVTRKKFMSSICSFVDIQTTTNKNV